MMKISIIIPTFNRKEILRELLLALAADSESQAAAEIEVIVANDKRRKDHSVKDHLCRSGSGRYKERRSAALASRMALGRCAGCSS
jgi:GT2 family glycosyltransferase